MPKKFIDLSGQRFGRLLVLKRIEDDKWGTLRYLCLCNCGRKTVVRGGHLNNGSVRSCGCLLKEGNYSKHRHTKTHIYYVWTDMLRRCNYKKHKRYKDYGGRGIKVCDRWSNKENGFQNFLKDVGLPGEGLTLDRIDNNGNYETRNWIWATRKQQNRNTRKNKLYYYNGAWQCVSALAEENKIHKETLRSRLKTGM